MELGDILEYVLHYMKTLFETEYVSTVSAFIEVSKNANKVVVRASKNIAFYQVALWKNENSPRQMVGIWVQPGTRLCWICGYYFDHFVDCILRENFDRDAVIRRRPVSYFVWDYERKPPRPAACFFKTYLEDDGHWAYVGGMDVSSVYLQKPKRVKLSQ